MSKKSQNVLVKKVSPYPMPAKITGSDGKEYNGQILKLTPTGFMVEVQTLSVKVGKSYQAEFALKLTDRQLKEKARVVKTYDKIHTSVPGEQGGQVTSESTSGEEDKSAGSRRIFRLAEMHFIGIGLDERKWIRDFALSIQQSPEKP